MTFPEPTAPAMSRADVFMTYLDFFRNVIVDKVSEMPADDRVRSRLPSGWTPLELLVHLTFVERRWLEWGFEDPDLPDPWGDQHEGRWRVPGDRSFEDVVASLLERGAVTRRIVASHDLDDVGRRGDRWAGRRRAWNGSCSICSRSTRGMPATWMSSPSWSPAGPGSDGERREPPWRDTGGGRTGWECRRPAPHLA